MPRWAKDLLEVAAIVLCLFASFFHGVYVGREWPCNMEIRR
jgi:hypothetical protein